MEGEFGAVRIQQHRNIRSLSCCLELRQVVPFVYTFPAYDASKITWVDKTCTRCPKTVNLLRQLPRLRTALFSRLGPSARISAHTVEWHIVRSLALKPVDTCSSWTGLARSGELRAALPSELENSGGQRLRPLGGWRGSLGRLGIIADPTVESCTEAFCSAAHLVQRQLMNSIINK